VPGFIEGSSWPVKTRVTPGGETPVRLLWSEERERLTGERDDRWVPLGGERERRGELGWVGSGRSGPAGFPGAAQLGSWPLSFIFFPSAFFFFCSEFLF
jgi:hypothetical protein